MDSTTIAMILTVLGIIILLELGIIAYMLITAKKGKRAKGGATPKQKATHSALYLAHVAFFSALGVALLYLEFPLLPATPWLEMNFSDVPTLLAAFMYGPVTGAVVNIIKIVVKLLISGTSTNLVGPLSNLISGTVYAVTAGIIYMIRRNKKIALLSLGVSSAVFCAAMWLCNQFILLPVYGMTEPEVMMPALWWTLLFNVIKTLATDIITFFIYKPLSRALHWEFNGKKKKEQKQSEQSTQDTKQSEQSVQDNAKTI